MKVRKILFITLSNIGDVILTLPVLSGLKDNFPDGIIDVVVGPRPKEVFKKDPRVRKILVYDKQTTLKEKINFIKSLRSEKYDLAVDMRRSLMPVLIGARRKTSLFPALKTGDRHKHTVHLNKLRELGLNYKAGQGIYIDDDDRRKIDRLLERYGCDKESVIIGISPSTRGILKQWQTDGFVEVIRALLEKKNYKAVLIGDTGQVDISGRITRSLKDSAMIDLTGKINLNELFALIEHMRLLLTGDSAALHIASDLGIKTVALFGPTDPAEYGPRGKDTIVIRKRLKCSPCRKARCTLNHECMKQIEPGEVLDAVIKLLD